MIRKADNNAQFLNIHNFHLQQRQTLLYCSNLTSKELEVKIRELGEKESAKREALKEEITGRLNQKVGDLASEVSLALNLSNPI